MIKLQKTGATDFEEGYCVNCDSKLIEENQPIGFNYFIKILETYTRHKDRNTKRHAHGLLKALQELNPQDND